MCFSTILSLGDIHETSELRGLFFMKHQIKGKRVTKNRTIYSLLQGSINGSVNYNQNIAATIMDIFWTSTLQQSEIVIVTE